MSGEPIFSKSLGDASSFDCPGLASAAAAAVRLVVEQLRVLYPDLCQESQAVSNERGLTEFATLHLNGACAFTEFSFAFQAESMEDRSRGDSPAVDIGVFWQLPGQPATRWPRVTAIEAKRLDTTLPMQRRREYVVGHGTVCGGMERFKKGIHGRELRHKAMLLGYVQSDDMPTWHRRINEWIISLAAEPGHKPVWNDSECLADVEFDDGVAVCESTLLRADDSLRLVHVWIDLSNPS